MEEIYGKLNLSEIDEGAYIVIAHYIQSTINDSKNNRRFNNRHNPRTLNANGTRMPNYMNCTAKVMKISRLYGHTYRITYSCFCNRLFEERVKGGTQFEVLTHGQAMMKMLIR